MGRKLTGKTAIITGGTKGIGFGIAAEFIKEGASVAIIGRNAETGKKAADTLTGLGGNAIYVQGDVADLNDLDKLIEKTVEEFGRLAVFLAGEDSNFIFGQSIYNDGGRSFQAFPTPGYKTVTDKDYELLQKAKGRQS
jgi:enoyl-[acyl-carrier-protein] reductase (NADH)